MSGADTFPGGMQRQRGTSLLVVMVALVLGSLLVVSSARVAWLNEKLVGNQSDHQRAIAAAEALLRDAESDIRGERFDGTPCSSDPKEAGCRGAYADGRPFFPVKPEDLETLSDRIAPNKACRQGICRPPSTGSINPKDFVVGLIQAPAAASSDAAAASYGQFTGAAASAANPLLTGPSAKAWYWVEVFHYDLASPLAQPSENLPQPDAKHPFVYRINAYVQGHQAGTQTWLRSVFIPVAQQPSRP